MWAQCTETPVYCHIDSNSVLVLSNRHSVFPAQLTCWIFSVSTLKCASKQTDSDSHYCRDSQDAQQDRPPVSLSKTAQQECINLELGWLPNLSDNWLTIQTPNFIIDIVNYSNKVLEYLYLLFNLLFLSVNKFQKKNLSFLLTIFSNISTCLYNHHIFTVHSHSTNHSGYPE